MWNLKYHTNKTIYKRETDSQTENRKQTCGYQGGTERGVGWMRSLGLLDANYYTNKE